MEVRHPGSWQVLTQDVKPWGGMATGVSTQDLFCILSSGRALCDLSEDTGLRYARGPSNHLA